TPILGRGTDFKPILPNGQKHPKGLLVIQTYVDTERTSRQVIGRSGRQGHHGETVCIIDEEALQKKLGVAPKEKQTDNQQRIQMIEDIRKKWNESSTEQRKNRQAYGTVRNM